MHEALSPLGPVFGGEQHWLLTFRTVSAGMVVVAGGAEGDGARVVGTEWRYVHVWMMESTRMESCRDYVGLDIICPTDVAVLVCHFRQVPSGNGRY